MSQQATQSEIKRSFRQMALLKHPDKNPDDPQAVENFQKLNQSYQLLSDPKKRKRYDEFGDDGQDGDFTS